MARFESRPPSEAAQQLKIAACKLFAERGVDGVSVREIAEAAGHKNSASLGYHFGSKEDLIRLLVVDGARVIDAQRNRMLDTLEAIGGPNTIRDVTDLIIRSAVELPDRSIPPTYSRFVVLLGLTHRHLFMDALDGRWNSGYQRCLGYLRALMPDMPLPLKNQRLVFMGALMGSMLALRQVDELHPERPHPAWQTRGTLDHLSGSLAAILDAPVEQMASRPEEYLHLGGGADATGLVL